MASELPTPSELVQIGQAKIRVLQDPQGTGAVNLHPGSRWDMALSVNAALAARNSAHIADRAAARSLQSAVGDDLAIIAADLYNDGPLPANASTGYVYLQRSGTGATVVYANSRFGAAASGTQPAVVMQVSADTPVGVGVLKVALPVFCATPGVAGNVLLSAVTSILDQLPDTTWSLYVPVGGDSILNGLSDPPPIAGGSDAETDDQLRARLKQAAFDDSKKRGTKRAIIVGASQVPGINGAGVVAIEPMDGSVRLFCGDVNYNLSPQLQALVQTQLEGFRALGCPVFVLPFAVTTVTVTATIRMQRPLVNYNSQAIVAQAVTNILAYFMNRTQPDEYFVNSIITAIENANSEVQDVALTLPSSSVLRLAPATYSTLSSLPRYTCTSSNIFLTVVGPVTQ